MATSVRKRTSLAPVRRSNGPSPKLVKLQQRLATVAKRGAQTASKNESLLFTLGAPAVLALMEKRGVKLPALMGLDPYLVAGAALYLGGAKLASGRNGRRLEAAGEGLLAAASARAVQRGGVRTRVSGDEVEIDDEIDGSIYEPAE